MEVLVPVDKEGAHDTLWDPMDCSPSGFSGYWTRLPFPPPGDLLDPGIEPASFASPILASRFFTTNPAGKPPDDCPYDIQILTLLFPHCVTLGKSFNLIFSSVK